MTQTSSKSTRSARSEPATDGERARAAFLVGAGIFLSRISGLLRQAVFSFFFGLSDTADAWVAALKLPNVLQNLLGEGTLSASFIPIYAEFLAKGKEEEAGRFAGAALGLLATVGGGLAVLGMFMAPYFVPLFFFRWDPDKQALTVTLVRILFPMTAVLVLSAWSLGILNSHRRFFVSYVAPVLWNLAMVSTLVGVGIFLAAGQGDLVVSLAWGALAGGVLQLAVQLPFVWPLLRHVRVSLGRGVEGVREGIVNFLPVVSARGVVILSGWLDLIIAGLVTGGTVAALQYAQTLYILPISLFGMSLAASELPELSRERGASAEVLTRRMSDALTRLSYFIVPSVVAYLVLGDRIIALIYQRGEFTSDGTRVAYIVLAAYALGLMASARSRVLSSAYYALRDTRTPARIATARIAVSLVVGASLMFPLDRLRVGAFGLGAAGLALGSSAGAWFEYSLLSRRLRQRIGRSGEGSGKILRLLAVALVAGGLAYLIKILTGDWTPVPGALGTLIPFGVVYLGSTWLMGDSPFGKRSRSPEALP